MTSVEDELERERLHFAAANGDLGEVTRLLASGFDPNAFDTIGKTPLHYACEEEHLDVVRFLLANGVQVDAQDESKIGNTALGEVAGVCSLDVARILVDAGADPTLPGWMQLSALHRAKERKNAEGRAVYALLLKVAEASRRSRTR